MYHLFKEVKGVVRWCVYDKAKLVPASDALVPPLLAWWLQNVAPLKGCMNIIQAVKVI